MNKNKRILIEVLAPPFLAAVWLVISSIRSESLSGILSGFLPLLLFAYTFGIIPAVLYALVMESWFWSGMQKKFGSICTSGFSSILGAIAGCLSGALATQMGILVGSDYLHLLPIGGLIGLVIGYYVGKTYPSTAS